VPFLDNEVIDLAARVPSDLKIRAGREDKVVLKLLAARIFPHDIVYRRKVGFGTPLAKWLRNPRGLGRYVDLLLDDAARARGYVDHGHAARLVREHREGRHDHSELIWSLLSLELWCRSVIDQTDLRNDLAAAGTVWHRELAKLRDLRLGMRPVIASHSGMAV
jgi:asparagine synthase (glutamine-hydrolysing)